MDGIERVPGVLGSDFVTPYRPAGSEFYKYRFLMDTLIPNQHYTFPNASLNMVEQVGMSSSLIVMSLFFITLKVIDF